MGEERFQLLLNLAVVTVRFMKEGHDSAGVAAGQVFVERVELF
jgi:hypothetical protein